MEKVVAKMPMRFIKDVVNKEVGNFAVGEVGYISAGSVAVDEDMTAYLYKHAKSRAQADIVHQFKVERHEDGYHLFLGHIDHQWEPGPVSENLHLEVASIHL